MRLIRLLSVRLLPVVVALCCAGSPAAATTIADSLADFSGVQNHNGWYYGYLSGSFSESSFSQLSYLPCGNDLTWALHTCVNSAPWTGFGEAPNGQQGADVTPNGANSGTVEWADRRWVSDYAGEIYIYGNAYHNPTLLNSGASEYVDVFVDGTEMFHRLLGGSDSTGFAVNVAVSVLIGSKVDFVVEPSNPDYYDHVVYTAQILDTPTPEPGTAALLAVALVIAWAGHLAQGRV